MTVQSRRRFALSHTRYMGNPHLTLEQGWPKLTASFMVSGCERAVFLMMCVLLFGCTSPKQFAPLPDQTKAIQDATKTRIYVMRPGNLLASSAPGVMDGPD